ncbi:hypothetical protein [Bradyrhizobium sp. CER78]|uniref:hypothetical protein n=1 Tax=Bradyrhizobium sp. CER78 TaxID=3039162 RepID=UPI00244B89E5|nr:hypothetical protein [Bradyrhizobium sp. CER78]MDH2384903.1 hypothetical protein [Bradyrhizobium sp. CER78]
MGSDGATEPQGKLLCAWQLAVLRFAVTLDNAERMHVLAVARELDRIGGDYAFQFFRRTTAELCHAITGSDAKAEAMVRRFEAQIDNLRLRRALELAVRQDRPPPKLVATRRGHTPISGGGWRRAAPPGRNEARCHTRHPAQRLRLCR